MVGIARPYLVLHRNRYLIWQLTKREVLGRYRGSVLGLFWSVAQPLFLLAIYAVVFGHIFPSRWPIAAENAGTGAFAVILFAGLIPHALLSEMLVRAPGLVLANPSYVKKFVFPIEVLPWTAVLAALFHTAASYLILLGFYFAAFGTPHAGLLVAPLLLLPLALLAVGLGWLLAALGVYLRDVGQIMGMVSTALLFLSPIFYPLSAVPPELTRALYLNPLTFVVEQFRGVMVFGRPLDWQGWGIYVVIALLVAWLGHAFFQRARRGFADVL